MPGLMSFPEAAQTAIAVGSADLTEAQMIAVANLFGDGSTEGPKVRLVKRLVYNRLISSGKIPRSTPIDAIDWATIIQELIDLIPMLIPLICPTAAGLQPPHIVRKDSALDSDRRRRLGDDHSGAD